MEDIGVPIPKGKQVLGIIEEVVGWAHAKVRCFDGKTRICRVPKKLSKNIWLRRGAYVLVDPWEIEGDRKGDIIYTYDENEIEYLKRKGLIKFEEEF